MAKTKGRRMGRTALDLTKNVEQPGAKPKPMIVSKKTGKTFPPPPPGGVRIKTATEIYEEHGRPEPKSPEWNACVAAIGKVLDRRMCYGYAKQRDIPCTRSPVEGRDYCDFHGGQLAAGTDHGHFVDGTQAGRKHLARLTDERRAELRAARPQSRTELLGLAQSADEQELWARIAADPLNTDAGPHLASIDLRQDLRRDAKAERAAPRPGVREVRALSPAHSDDRATAPARRVRRANGRGTDVVADDDRRGPRQNAAAILTAAHLSDNAGCGQSRSPFRFFPCPISPKFHTASARRPTRSPTRPAL